MTWTYRASSVLHWGQTWVVTTFGLERRNGSVRHGTDYTLSKARLADKSSDGLVNHLAYLPRKSCVVDVDDFCDTYVAALRIHNKLKHLTAEELQASIAKAKESARWARGQR